jgi:hypothetical protein
VADTQKQSSGAREPKERLLAIRIPQSLLESIDEHVELMRVEIPWVHMTRSDVVRWMLTASIDRYRVDRQAFRSDVKGPPENVSEAS